MKDLQVKLVTPSVWRPLMENSFEDLTSQERRFARSVLMTMHNRHIGVTPELVAELTPPLLDPSAQSGVGGAWAVVFERLLKELSPGTGTGSKSRSLPMQRRFGLLLNSIPLYSIIRLAMPIVERACRQIGLCYLFCADEIETSIGDTGYSKHSNDLSQAIIEIARSEEDEFQLFWKDRAITLSSFSRQPGILGRSNMPLPEVDPTALGFLLRLKPDMPPSKQQPQSPRRLPKPFTHRKSQRQKEGGIDGIRITRREEDIDSILLSEFFNPEIILADHLTNVGFLAIQRQPKRDKLRDVLIAALMPGQIRAKPNADFVKACWFDCLMRLSLMLRQHRLHQSEFRWIEGDIFDRARTCAFLLQDMPIFKTAFERGPSEPYRREFLTRLRWLPFYLNTRDRFSALPDNGTEAEEEGPAKKIARLTKWASAAWAGQQENMQWTSHERDKSGRGLAAISSLKSDEFAFVHLMLFLPANERNENLPNAASSLDRLYRGFGLGNYPGHNVSVTWVPDNLEKVTDWAFEARGGLTARLFPAKQLDITDQGIAGRLEQTWLDQLIKEMWRA